MPQHNTKRQKIEPFVLLFAMLFPTLLTFIYFVLLAGEAGSGQKTAYSVGKTLQFLLPIFWVAVVCKEKFFLRKFSPRGFYAGLIFGIAVFLAMLSIYLIFLGQPGQVLALDSSAASEIRQKIQDFGIQSIAVFALLAVFYSVIHSGLEEYYWRWFVFRKLKIYCPWLVAATVSSVGFMLHHILVLGTYFGYDSASCWFASLGVAVGGFVWAWIYQRSNSIWGVWVSHGIIDAAIFTIGAVNCFA